MVTYADLKTVSTVAKAPAAVRKVIEWWDTPDSPKVSFRNYTELLKKARQAALKPPTAFIDWLDETGLDDLEKFLRQKGVLDDPLAGAIEARRQTLARAAVAKIGANPYLHQPQNDSGYRRPTNAAKTVADRTGRSGGEWTRVPVVGVPGPRAKTTGSSNHALMINEMSTGNWKAVGDAHHQICPGCGRSIDVDLFETDHQQALSEIREELWKLADAMSADKALFERMRDGTPNFSLYFTGTPATKVQPTNAAVSDYSNDLGNLMRLCRTCNGASGKSDMAFLDWYKKNPLFGPDFVEHNLDPKSESILARTVHGTGWGEAARKWFKEHHLPILMKNFDIANVSERVRSSLMQQSIAATEAKSERNPSRKRKREEKANKLAGTNDAMVGSMVAIGDYLKKGPTIFAPGSPEQLVSEVKNVFSQREKRKFREKAEVSNEYMTGWLDGYEGFTSGAPAYESEEEVAKHLLGYHAGARARTHDREQKRTADKAAFLKGYEDGLNGRAPDETADGPYRQGFALADGYRLEAFALGLSDGAHGRLDPQVLQNGVFGEATLLRVYMEGFVEAQRMRARGAGGGSGPLRGAGSGSGPLRGAGSGSGPLRGAGGGSGSLRG